MKKVLYVIGLIFIALFLFITHSKFLHSLDPGKDSKLFILFGYDLKLLVPYLFGAAFGIVTTIIIALLDRKDRLFWLFVILTAILETIGVFLYNNTELIENVWKWFASVYYGLYSGFIIIMYAYIKLKDENKGFVLSEKEKNLYSKQSIKDSESFGESIIRNLSTIDLFIKDESDNINYEPIKPDDLFSIEERNKRIIKLSQEGKSAKEISQMFSLHIASVYRIINSNKNNNENEHK